MSERPILGIVGGLGPFSHVEFERRLLLAAREHGGVRTEQDFPEWILSSAPQTPDRTAALAGNAADPLPWLLRSLHRLTSRRTEDGEEIPGAGFAIIVCNTAHFVLPRLRPLSPLPLMELVDETVTFLARHHPGATVGILATSGTLASGLYHLPLAERGLRPVSLLDTEEGEDLERRLVMEPIYGGRDLEAIKLGGGSPEARARLEEAAGVLVERLGAQVLLLGCTEISMALRAAELHGRPVVDPLDVVARLAIERIVLGETEREDEDD
ncbi:MAG TPA: amino acid racemase [Thermoanaerobaculia bacterium]|nr:amino acid racemase [Thermoanaerobaculia bacterium]